MGLKENEVFAKGIERQLAWYINRNMVNTYVNVIEYNKNNWIN